MVLRLPSRRLLLLAYVSEHLPQASVLANITV